MRTKVTFALVALLSGSATGCGTACDPESFNITVVGHARDAARVVASGPCRVLHVCDAAASDATCASFSVRSTGRGKCLLDVTFADSTDSVHHEVEFGPTASCCSDGCVSDGTKEIRVQ